MITTNYFGNGNAGCNDGDPAGIGVVSDAATAVFQPPLVASAEGRVSLPSPDGTALSAPQRRPQPMSQTERVIGDIGRVSERLTECLQTIDAFEQIESQVYAARSTYEAQRSAWQRTDAPTRGPHPGEPQELIEAQARWHAIKPAADQARVELDHLRGRDRALRAELSRITAAQMAHDAELALDSFRMTVAAMRPSIERLGDEARRLRAEYPAITQQLLAAIDQLKSLLW